jgi:EmrB/QacA subfamily drug resistance transporter
VFGASFQQVQWVVLAYLLATTTLIIGAGRLSDLSGRRRPLLAGIALFTASSAACGIAPTLWLLIAARVVQGLGAAIMMALTLAFVGETVPAARTGSAMGLLGTMSAIGTALGPSLGGVLIAGLGWSFIFFAAVPLGLLTLLLALRFLPSERRGTQTGLVRFDYVGMLLLALTLAAYALAMTTGRDSFGLSNVALLITAAVGIGLFTLAEAKATSPLIQLSLFRDPVLSTGFTMSTLVTTVVMTTLVVGPFYLSGTFGLDPGRVGLVMSCGPIVAALAGVPVGGMVDHYGTYRMTLAGLIGIVAGCSLLPILPTSFGVPAYIGPLVVITADYALFQAANNTAVMAPARPDQRGITSGLFNLSRNLGLITGTSVMGTVFALGAATSGVVTASPEAVAAGMRLALAVAAALIFVALAIALVSHTRSRRSVHPNRDQEENRDRA